MNIEGYTIDQYMELLLEEWGMSWSKVVKQGEEHEKVGLKQIGSKRIGEGFSKEGKKKTKE